MLKYIRNEIIVFVCVCVCECARLYWHLVLCSSVLLVPKIVEVLSRFLFLFYNLYLTVKVLYFFFIIIIISCKWEKFWSQII